MSAFEDSEYPPHYLFQYWWRSHRRARIQPVGSILYRGDLLVFLNALKVSITAIAKI